MHVECTSSKGLRDKERPNNQDGINYIVTHACTNNDMNN